MVRRQDIYIWLLILLVFGVLVFLLRGILAPFLLGMAIAYFLDPVADKLENWGLSRTLSVIVITVVFFLGAAAVLALIIPLLSAQISSLAAKAPEYLNTAWAGLKPTVDSLIERLSEEDLEQLKEATGAKAGSIIQWFGRALGNIFQGGLVIIDLIALLVITPIVAFYLLRDWDRIVARVDSYLPKESAPKIRKIMSDIDTSIGGFVRGQVIVLLILGVFYAAALVAAGLEFGLVIGLGAGLISFVPYLGATVGFVVSVGMALVQFDEITRILIVGGIFIVGQVIEGNFLTPKLVGDRVGLHPVWVIFAVLAGGALFGFTGILLAIPLAATAGVLIRFGADEYKDSTLYQGSSGSTSAKGKGGGKRKKGRGK